MQTHFTHMNGNSKCVNCGNPVDWNKRCINCGNPVDKWEHKVNSTAIIAWNDAGLGLEVAEAFGWVRDGPAEAERDAHGEYVVCRKCLGKGVNEMIARGRF